MWIEEIKAGMVFPPRLRDGQPLRQTILIQVVRFVKPGQGVLTQALVDACENLPVARLQENFQRVGAQAGERQYFAGIHRQSRAIRKRGHALGKDTRSRLSLSRQQYLAELVEWQGVKRRLEHGR